MKLLYKNGDIIKTDADRTDGVDPLGELEKIIATAPKTEIKKTSKKGGKKTTKSTKSTKSVKKTKGKKTQKFTVPVVKVVEVPAETPKKRGRKSKKKEG